MMEQVTAEFLDARCREALRAIRGHEAAKKRATVLLLAMATASGTPLARVFEDERACNQRIWYQKWQNITTVAAALEVLTERALEWRDQETARIEAQALQEGRRAIARGLLDAVQGLRITALNGEDRADYRTEASRVLVTLADEELGLRLDKGKASVPVAVTDAPPAVVQVVMPDNGRGLAAEAADDADDAPID